MSELYNYRGWSPKNGPRAVNYISLVPKQLLSSGGDIFGAVPDYFIQGAIQVLLNTIFLEIGPPPTPSQR